MSRAANENPRAASQLGVNSNSGTAKSSPEQGVSTRKCHRANGWKGNVHPRSRPIAMLRKVSTSDMSGRLPAHLGIVDFHAAGCSVLTFCTGVFRLHLIGCAFSGRANAPC